MPQASVISPLRRTRAALIALGIAVAVGCSNDFRADVLRCEEAVARLGECCPGTDLSRIDCDYEEGCGKEYFPDITESQSQCIRDHSCEDLQKGGTCRGLTTSSTFDGGGVPLSSFLCARVY